MRAGAAINAAGSRSPVSGFGASTASTGDMEPFDAVAARDTVSKGGGIRQVDFSRVPAHVPRESRQLPCSAIEFDSFSGRNIHGIALNAVFAAARRQGTERIVTMPLVLAAIRSELRKLDKQVNETDLSGVRATRGAA
jgi:hypothetical protein